MKAHRKRARRAWSRAYVHEGRPRGRGTRLHRAGAKETFRDVRFFFRQAPRAMSWGYALQRLTNDTARRSVRQKRYNRPGFIRSFSETKHRGAAIGYGVLWKGDFSKATCSSNSCDPFDHAVSQASVLNNLEVCPGGKDDSFIKSKLMLASSLKAWIQIFL